MHWQHWCPRVKWKSSLMNSTNVFSHCQLIHQHEQPSPSVYYLFQKTGSVTGLFSQGPIRSTIKQAKLSSAKRLCEHLLQAGNYLCFITSQCNQHICLYKANSTSIYWLRLVNNSFFDTPSSTKRTSPNGAPTSNPIRNPVLFNASNCTRKQ